MENKIPIQLSKRVTSLRIILIFFVIVQHTTVFSPEEQFFTFWIKEFISNGMLYGNVALSFIFSGYFLAIKQHNYIDILKRKIRSLIIPYILWMLFYFLVYIILFHTNALHKYSQTIFKMDKWSLKNIVKIFLGYGAYLNTPTLAPQMWFIRDLIILSVLYPVFMYLYDFRKKYCIAFTLTIITAMGFLYGKGIFHKMGFYPIFFFSAGIIFGMYKINFFELADKLKYLDLLAGIIILVILNKLQSNIYPCFTPLLRFFSSLFWLKFSKYLIAHEKIFLALKKLSAYSFFIFAVHFKILVLAVQKIFSLSPDCIHNSGIFFNILMYIFAPLLTFGISLLIGIGVKKITPKFYSIITGGRT